MWRSTAVGAPRYGGGTHPGGCPRALYRSSSLSGHREARPFALLCRQSQVASTPWPLRQGFRFHEAAPWTLSAIHGTNATISIAHITRTTAAPVGTGSQLSSWPCSACLNTASGPAARRGPRTGIFWVVCNGCCPGRCSHSHTADGQERCRAGRHYAADAGGGVVGRMKRLRALEGRRPTFGSIS